MVPLVACPACARHVRVSEERCPFCDVATPDLRARIIPGASHRLGRLATFTFATTLALGGVAVGCGDDDAPPGPTQLDGGGQTGDGGGAAALYGAPASDASAAADARDESADAGTGGRKDAGSAALYGLPP
jgi:hypothetical protein